MANSALSISLNSVFSFISSLLSTFLMGILILVFFMNKFQKKLTLHVTVSRVISLFLLNGGCKVLKNQYPLPPGPKPLPFIGCLPQLFKNKPVHKWIHSLMNQMDTQIACIRLGSIHEIIVTCPKLAREFLTTHDAIMASRPLTMSTEIVSMGYLSAIFAPSGDQWKKMRKVLAQHVLSSAKLKWQHSKRIEEADNLVRYVFSQCMEPEKGGLVNVRIAARHYVGNLIRKLVFNRRYFGDEMKDGGPGYEEEEHVRALFDIINFVYAFSISDYFPCLKGLDLDGHKKVVNKSVAIISKYHDHIIEERIQSWKKGMTKETGDVLDTFITLKDDNGNPLLSINEIKTQIIELMLATVDNPSNAFEWALAEMLNHPDVLGKAVDELDRVVGKERLAQESDFPRLNYVKACIREAFRLHPFHSLNMPHVSAVDTVVGNYFIPKGSYIRLSRFGLGRNPKIWDEPLEFRPERHLKSDGSEVVLSEKELRFLTFSTGRRGCPGVDLGTSMTIMMFSRLLHGFSWSLQPNETRIDLTEADINLAPAKPLVALAKPRLPWHIYQAL